MKPPVPIILASKSPRRIELLNSLKLKFKVHPSSFCELKTKLFPTALVKKNAEGKALDIASQYPNSIIIGVDTIGAYRHHILEKPIHQADAFRLIKIISGTTHTVYSGLCLIDTRNNKKITSVVKTKVTFAKLTDQEITKYIETEEPMDKAAAFAAQGFGALFIKHIEGDYFNVVGLPIFRLGQMLKKLGISIL